MLRLFGHPCWALLNDVGYCWMIAGKVWLWPKMLDIIDCCWVMLEWFGHPTQQNRARVSAMINTRHVLNALSWASKVTGVICER